MSFDTVTFKKGFDPQGVDYWRKVGFSWAKNGRLIRNGDGLCLTVFPNGYQRKDWLMAQASLPKILFGHNATLPTEKEAREAASWLCGYVTTETRLAFPIEEVKLFRIDYTRDYDIREDRVHAMALKLFAMDVRSFSEVHRYADSVCFECKKDDQVIKQLAIYPKFIWARDTNQPPEVIDASRDKLRLEVRLFRDGLKGIKSASKPLDYLSQTTSDSLLNEAAAMLDLRRIINARNIDFHEIQIIHARGQGSLGRYGLCMFIELVKRYGEYFHLKPEFHYARSTYYKWKRELESQGSWSDLVAASGVQTLYE